MVPPDKRPDPLIHQVSLPDALPGEVGESVWIEVIQRMDDIYANLVEHQVELEKKNDALEKAYQELHLTHEELKRAQRQLVQAEKMASLGRLVAGVAHELNNPMSFLQGNAFALESYNGRLQAFFSALEALDPPGVRQLIEKNRIAPIVRDLSSLVAGTKEGTERVTLIVQNLLRFTTPQQQAAQVMDLAALVPGAVQWVCRGNRRPCEMNFELPDRLEILGFEGLVHQILVNLVQNAIDAMEHGNEPRLWVSVLPGSAEVRIVVRDNGPGVPDEFMDTIFDPFVTTKQSGKGTGLGLYISYLLATEQCGGSLTVENPPQGGAEFTLTLPLRCAEAGESES